MIGRKGKGLRYKLHHYSGSCLKIGSGSPRFSR
jgi:hypothetical protein